MTQAFARCYRLTKTDEFSSVFGFRKAIRGSCLMLHYQPRPPGSPSARLGLVIAKKMLKKSVDRNRVKRVVREQFRRCRNSLPPYDLIVRLVAKPGVLDNGKLADDFLVLVSKLRKPKVMQEEK